MERGMTEEAAAEGLDPFLLRNLSQFLGTGLSWGY